MGGMKLLKSIDIEKSDKVKKWYVTELEVYRIDRGTYATSTKDKLDGNKLSLEDIKKCEVVGIVYLPTMGIIYVKAICENASNNYFFYKNSVGFRYFEDMYINIRDNKGYVWAE